MENLRKEITFFYSNGVERETVVPVESEARRRGYATRLTDQPFEKAHIGLYCQHDCFPANSRLSLVMLHDMGQGQLNWPNMWRFEPWNEFDAGILPGDVWARRWQESSAHPYTRPRLGVYKLGWPKSDAILQVAGSSLSAEAARLRDKLNLQHEVSILYAPAWENDGKQDEFVQSLKDLPVNLLLKQFPWTDEWPDMVRNVAQANAMHRDIAPNVHIIDAETSIMQAIELCDVMVSEESSCLVEALIKGRPAISVSDWLVPDTQPPRLPAAPFEFLIRTPKRELRDTVSRVLADLPSYQAQARQNRDENFSNPGNSAARIMDLIDALVAGEEIPFEPLPPAEMGSVPLRDRFRRNLRNCVYTFKYRLGIKQPLKKLVYDFFWRWRR